MNKKYGINFAIFFFIIVIITLSYSVISDLKLKQKGIKTEGIVIYTEKNRPYAKSIFYTTDIPVVRYIDSFGKDYRILDCENCHKVGEKVPIIYNPQNPENAMVDTKSSDFNLIYYLIGSIGFLIFFIILRKKMDRV